MVCPGTLVTLGLCSTYLNHRIIKVKKYLNPAVVPLAASPCSPSSHVLKCHTHAFWMLWGRVTPSLLWVVLSDALHPFCEDFFPPISHLNLPGCSSWPFPLILSLLPGRRGQFPPGYNLLSGTCRELWGLPWAASSPG